MSRPTQLPLTLPHSPHYGRDDFIIGPSNLAALRMLETWPDGSSPVAVLSGPAGSGKTHLVHIWAERTGATAIPAADIERAWSIDERLLALEDIQPAGTPQALLFHLLNRAKEQGGAILLTSRTPAAEWNVTLADLQSRLRMATPIAIGEPNDDLLRQALVKLFADRQLLIEKPVVDYLLARMERSLAAAVDLVDLLDRAALAAGRSITRPMAAKILAEAGLFEPFADRQ
jgi:chromosomal replication initiation ATPase DnaA